MRFFLLGLLLWLGLGASSWAHRIYVFANYEGKEIQGEVYFNDGRPAKAQIEIEADGEVFKTETNTQGKFTFSLPHPAHRIKISAYAGMGHKATVVIKGQNAGKPVSKQPASSQQTPAQRALGPSWRDIFCGLGYIVGVFGFLAYLKARTYGSKKRPEN